MNTLEMLKRVFAYFEDDTHPAGYRDGNCVYYANGSDPVRCAVGCLIPEAYEVRAGRVLRTVAYLIDTIPELEEYFDGVDMMMLQHVQEQHDSWARSNHNVRLPETTRADFLFALQMMIRYEEEA